MNEWEYYARCSRIKTKRQKKRLRKWDSDKHLRSLHFRLWQLSDEQDNLGYKELVPPVQRGWKRIFVVRPDVARSKDGAFFENLLQKINTEQLSTRRDFKLKKRRKGKKVHVAREQKLKYLCVWEYNKLKLTEKEKRYFTAVQELKEKGQYQTKYVFTEPWRYVLKVLPNLITKVKVIDPILEQMEAEVDAELDKRMQRRRLDHILDGHHQYRGFWENRTKPKYLSIYKAEPIAKLLNEFYNENKQ